AFALSALVVDGGGVGFVFQDGWKDVVEVSNGFKYLFVVSGQFDVVGECKRAGFIGGVTILAGGQFDGTLVEFPGTGVVLGMVEEIGGIRSGVFYLAYYCAKNETVDR